MTCGRGSRPLRVMHSALCTRSILNLRRVAARTSGGMDSYISSTTLTFETLTISDEWSEGSDEGHGHLEEVTD